MQLKGFITLELEDGSEIQVMASQLIPESGSPEGNRHTYRYRDPVGQFTLLVRFDYEERHLCDLTAWFPEERIEVAYDYENSFLKAA